MTTGLDKRNRYGDETKEKSASPLWLKRKKEGVVDGKGCAIISGGRKKSEIETQFRGELMPQASSRERKGSR